MAKDAANNGTNGIEMKDISTEEFREYFYPGDPMDAPSIRIDAPLAINTSASSSGGHRIIASDGFAYYVPGGWKLLRLKPKKNEPVFSF